MKYLQLLIFILLSFFINPLFSQTGPGGVGSNDGTSDVTLWLDANTINQNDNTRIASWLDNSGYNNNATNNANSWFNSEPTLKGSSINGYPKIGFNSRRRERLSIDDHESLKPNTISVFVVGSLTNNSATWGGFISKQSGSSWNDGYALSRNNGGASIGAYVSNWNQRKLTTSINYGTNNIMTLNYNKSNITLYKNELEASSKGYNGNINNSSSSLWLGWADGAWQGHYLDGDIAETIILKRHVNDAERIIIHNYLSAKYNIPLEANNHYKQDSAENGHFDHNVAGIGKAADGSSHSNSQGTGIARVSSNASSLSNNSFLFWGENEKNSSYAFVPSGSNCIEMLNSTWGVSNVNNLGAVSVGFDVSKINTSGIHSGSPLQLVVYNNSDLLLPKAVYQLNASGNVDELVTLADGDYFTLARGYIVWNGTNFKAGSGVNEEPTLADSDKTLLILPGADSARINEKINVCEIQVQVGATLNIADGIELTVQNSILNNGTINLLDEAQLIQKHTGANINSGTGKLKISQQGTTNLYNYNYWSSPVNRDGSWQIGFLEQNSGIVLFNPNQSQTPTSNPVTLSSRWLYKYNASETLANGIMGWVRINTSTNIEPGIGYTMKGSGSTTTEEAYVFSGTANSGDYSFTATEGNDFLIGNPYPSALNATQFIKDNLEVTEGTLYFYEQFATNNTHVWRSYQGGYAVLNLLAGTAASADSQLGNGGASTKGKPTNSIAVGQGFFVNITQDGTINFNNAQRVFAKESNGDSVFYRENTTNTNTDTRTKFWLTFTDPSGRGSEIALGYDTNATSGIDKGYDALDYSDYPDKMLWDVAENLLVIQGLQQFNMEDDIPVSIKVTNPGTYTIGLKETMNFPENTPIYLKDNMSNRYYDLKAADATITFQAGAYNNQYSIVYQQETLSIPTLETNQSVFVTFDENTDNLQLFGIDNLKTITGVYMYTVDGKQVYYTNSLESNRINISNFNAGIYVLKFEQRSGGIQSIKFVKY